MSIISCCTNAMLNANIALKVGAFPLGNVLLALDYKLIRFLALAFYDASSCVIEPLV